MNGPLEIRTMLPKVSEERHGSDFYLGDTHQHHILGRVWTHWHISCSNIQLYTNQLVLFDRLYHSNVLQGKCCSPLKSSSL